jgi:hypothetical protein
VWRPVCSWLCSNAFLSARPSIYSRPTIVSSVTFHMPTLPPRDHESPLCRKCVGLTRAGEQELTAHHGTPHEEIVTDVLVVGGRPAGWTHCGSPRIR